MDALRTRLGVAGLAIVSALLVLAACSGGTTGSPPAIRASPTATPGYVVGSSFYYVGTSDNQDTTYDGTAALNVTGTTTGTGSEFNSEEVLGGQSFNGLSGLLDFREYVSYVTGTPYTEVFDNYETFVPTANSGANVVYVGNLDVDQITPSDRLSSTTINAAPQIIDVLPHAAAAPYAEIRRGRTTALKQARRSGRSASRSRPTPMAPMRASTLGTIRTVRTCKIGR